jgi:hypothetical protein
MQGGSAIQTNVLNKRDIMTGGNYISAVLLHFQKEKDSIAAG